MPQLAYHVSDLQQKTAQATVHDLVHANHVLELAKQWSAAGIWLKFLPLEKHVYVNMFYHAHDNDYRHNRQRERRRLRAAREQREDVVGEDDDLVAAPFVEVN